MIEDFDDTALCYFAALIHGIRLVNEKEAERGLPFGSVSINAEALVYFVRDKGDVLVHHMNEEKKARTPHLRWTPDEMQLVVAECRRMCPDGNSLRQEHLIHAQEVLPIERRKDKFASNVVTYMRNTLRTGDGRKSGGTKTRYHRTLQVHDTVSPARTVPAIRSNGQLASLAELKLSGDESVTEPLAGQIAAAVIEVSIQALTLAVERLRNI